MILTEGLVDSMAQCQAMIEILADNRLLAMEIFKAMPDEYLERFEECIKRVSKYLDDLED